MFKNVTLGCDPELFLYNPQENTFHSVIGLIGGTKEQPRDIGNGCAVQEDNMAAEYCTPATANLSDWHTNHLYVQQWLEQEANKHGLSLSTKCTARFPHYQYDNEAAWLFGCDPDFDASTGLENPAPKANDKYMRTAGGHIHIGYSTPDVVTTRKLMLMMDLIVGVPSIVLDTDTERRELYGKPSAHRIKPYGGEYRTLSNFWIHSEELRTWAFDETLRAVDMMKKVDELLTPQVVMACRAAINKCDKALASFLIKRHGLNALGA